MAIDINTTTTGVVLPTEIAQEIWQPTVEQSAFMTLAKPLSVPGAGIEFQQITGDPVAAWTGETELAPVSTHTFGHKKVNTYKLSVIEPFSIEFLANNDALYDACISRLPGSFAKKYDGTIMGTVKPGDNFDVLGDCSKVSILPEGDQTVYQKFLAADAAISAADGIMNGIALAPQGRSIVLGAVDGVGRPLFTPGVESNSVGNILGARVSQNKGVYVAGTADTEAIVGVAGDFDDAYYGYTNSITMTIDRSATLKDGDKEIHLFQQDMVAAKFTWYLTFVVKNTAEFVLLTGAKASA